MTFEELRPLLRWRTRMLRRPVAPEALSDSLSDIPYAEIPRRYYPLVVGFRHRRQDQRLAVCKRFLRCAT